MTTEEESAAAVFEVKTVPVDLDGADGIMRKINVEGSVDKAAAEDRSCFPPATPTCVSTLESLAYICYIGY